MAPGPVLLDLCDELILQVLSFLDVSDLLSASRTCRRLRHLCNDPVLHAHRLQEASTLLAQSLSNRPPLSALRPPTSTIYLSSTHLVARNLSRSLISIKLNRSLSRRPSATSLVTSNILPEECCRHDPETGEVIWGAGVAPAIIGVKRQIEREKLKDGLRAWLAGRGVDIVQKKSMLAGTSERDKPSVRTLVQRFAKRAGGKDFEVKQGILSRRESIERKERGAPPRAHVLGLRRFWEGIGRQSQTA